jgi:hypothetical protein
MKKKKNHTWLFAFTDLSFLLLISLSLIPSAPTDITIRFAEMDVPVVPDSSNLSPVESKGELWELQVYALSEAHPKPYALRRSPSGDEPSLLLDQDNLIQTLETLRSRDIRPVLIPEKTSLSQDFLFAAAALTKVWSGGGNRTIVQPLPLGEAR